MSKANKYIGNIGAELQYPLPTDSDSVYIKDVNFKSSTFTNWTGDYENLFLSPESPSITNSTSDPIKTIVIKFNRSVKAQQIGLGENNGGSFSNVRITLLGSGNSERSIYDMSTDNTLKTSLNAEFENEIFNSVKIEFLTTSNVSLSNITIQKARYGSNQIQGKDPNGDLVTFRATRRKNFPVALEEYQGDAFGRLRTSEPYTIFDNSFTSPQSDSLFWSTLTGGTAPNGFYDHNNSQYITQVFNDGDYIVRQTKQRFKYQPGHSHEFFITGLLDTQIGIRKRVGLVDYDNVNLTTITNTPQNGIFFENSGGTLSWNIVKNGVVIETVYQNDWNSDTLDGNDGSRNPSDLTLDINSTNIFFADLEWLGVGTARVGFVINGEIVIVHKFHHASNGFYSPYMRTANLPVAYECTAFSATTGQTNQICTSIISEGGYNPQGVGLSLKNNTPVAVGDGSVEPLIGLRLKPESFEYSVLLDSISAFNDASTNTILSLCFNPTLSAEPIWNDVPYSNTQYAVNSASTITVLNLGIRIGGFFISAAGNNAATSTTVGIDTTIRLGKGLNDDLDEIWLVAEAIGINSIYGQINFKDLM